MAMLLIALVSFATTTAKAQAPQFSTDTDVHWYQIINNGHGGNKYVTLVDEETPNFLKGIDESTPSDNNLFKLVGTADSFQIFCKADPTNPIGAPNQNGHTKLTVNGGTTNTFKYQASSVSGFFVLATTGGQCLDNYGPKISFWGNFPDDGANRQYKFKEYIESNALVPTFSVPTNTAVITGDEIQIATTGDQIVYTTDGTDPSDAENNPTTSTGNTVNIPINAETVVKAYTVQSGKNNSEIVTATFDVIEGVELGKKYQVVFRRNGGSVGDNLALTQGENDSDVLTLSTSAIGQSKQLFIFSKASVKGMYLLQSAAGKWVYFDGGRFKTSSSETATTLCITKFTPNNAFRPAYCISRQGNLTSGMNPNGGSTAGKEIGEYSNTDGGNALKFVEEVTDYKSLLQSDIAKHRAWVQSVVGDDFGQMTAATLKPLTDGLDQAEAINLPDVSDTKYLDAINQLKNGRTSLINEENINTDMNLLVGSDNTKYRWYTITSLSSYAYATGKVITSNGATDKFKFEDKDDSDAQLFRFEVVVVGEGDDQKEYIKIFNKGNGKYIGSAGAVADAAVNFEVDLMKKDGSYAAGIHETGQNLLHAQESQSVIVAWPGGVGSSSAWKFDFVKVTNKSGGETALNSVNDVRNSVVVVNGVITVSGVDSFEVYSLAGQKVNANQQLQAGVYIVKTTGFACKVVVK